MDPGPGILDVIKFSLVSHTPLNVKSLAFIKNVDSKKISLDKKKLKGDEKIH